MFYTIAISRQQKLINMKNLFKAIENGDFKKSLTINVIELLDNKLSDFS